MLTLNINGETHSVDVDPATPLLWVIRDYVGLIRGHILKEDNVLFNMADQMVTGPRCTRLCAAYDETGAHTFDGCSKRELEELGREILAGV